MPAVIGSLLPLLLLAPPSPWIERVTPQRDTWTLGAYGGAFVLSERNDLYDLRAAPPSPLRRVGPLGGLRGGYFPLSFVGVEAEWDGIFTELADGREPVFAWGLRGHAIVQLPFYRVVPFALGGYGVMGVRSSREAVGNDIDPAGHYGLGISLRVTPWLAVRLDGRHVMSAAAARRRAVAHHGAVTLGLTFSLGRTRPEPAPTEPAPIVPSPILVDSDRDGIADERDRCPDQPGTDLDGCEPVDADADGIVDHHDACPALPGTQADGCAPPDADADGIIDRHDACPDEPGTTADGCLPPQPADPTPTEPVPAVNPLR